MDIISFKGKVYPKFQSDGFSGKFIFPFVDYFCKGKGYDIGCGKKEWAYKNAIPIDINFNDGNDAYNLPIDKVDYIFSSHCLEHLTDWVGALDYWTSKLKKFGVLFLYLPDYSQEYWRPWNNRKHKHILTPEIIKDYLYDRNYDNIFISGVDLNNSFACVAEKQ